jgi:orotidine-5'-phosphate decarboxylase
MQSYLDRSSNFTNPTAIRLLQLMDRKRTNLCVAVDCTTKAELLAITRQIGPFICLLKTHIDIILDFDQDLIEQLLLLSKHFDFMIFEDRKFADIGNTVKLQYSGGIYKISSWADITNAHAVPVILFDSG